MVHTYGSKLGCNKKCFLARERKVVVKSDNLNIGNFGQKGIIKKKSHGRCYGKAVRLSEYYVIKLQKE